jgi:hypothetical protein
MCYSLRILHLLQHHSMAREFEELVDGHNYHILSLDVKISMPFRGLMSALGPLVDRDAAFLDS